MVSPRCRPLLQAPTPRPPSPEPPPAPPPSVASSPGPARWCARARFGSAVLFPWASARPVQLPPTTTCTCRTSPHRVDPVTTRPRRQGARPLKPIWFWSTAVPAFRVLLRIRLLPSLPPFSGHRPSSVPILVPVSSPPQAPPCAHLPRFNAPPELLFRRNRAAAAFPSPCRRSSELPAAPPPPLAPFRREHLVLVLDGRH